MIPRKPDGTFAKKQLGYRKKICPVCGRKLWLREYYPMINLKKYPDGHDSRCIECRRREKREEYARNRKKPDGCFRGSDGRIIEKNGVSRRLYWGEMKIRDFKRLYPYHTNEWLAVRFDVSYRTVVRRAREMGLVKDAEWMANIQQERIAMMRRVNRACGVKYDRDKLLSVGEPYRFKPGHASTVTHESQKKMWKTRKRNKRL